MFDVAGAGQSVEGEQNIDEWGLDVRDVQMKFDGAYI